jgi:hypothetical protein
MSFGVSDVLIIRNVLIYITLPKVDPVSGACGSCLDLCIGSFTGAL